MGVGKWLKIVDEDEFERGTYVQFSSCSILEYVLPHATICPFQMAPGMHVLTARKDYNRYDFRYRLARFFSYVSSIEMLELDFRVDPISYDIVLQIIGKMSVKSVLLSFSYPRTIHRLPYVFLLSILYILFYGRWSI